MTKPFIPRSQRSAEQARRSFDGECDKLQNINDVNKTFWEKKKEEEAQDRKRRYPFAR